jgi:hypothetical protein
LVRSTRQGKGEDENQKNHGVKTMHTTQEPKFVICIRNEDCDDLELRKVYQVLPDKKASQDGYLRVVDDSGEDYLYPESYFVPVSLSLKAKDAVLVER